MNKLHVLNMAAFVIGVIVIFFWMFAMSETTHVRYIVEKPDTLYIQVIYTPDSINISEYTLVKTKTLKKQK